MFWRDKVTTSRPLGVAMFLQTPASTLRGDAGTSDNPLCMLCIARDGKLPSRQGGATPIVGGGAKGASSSRETKMPACGFGATRRRFYTSEVHYVSSSDRRQRRRRAATRRAPGGCVWRGGVRSGGAVGRSDVPQCLGVQVQGVQCRLDDPAAAGRRAPQQGRGAVDSQSQPGTPSRPLAWR